MQVWDHIVGQLRFSSSPQLNLQLLNQKIPVHLFVHQNYLRFVKSSNHEGDGIVEYYLHNIKGKGSGSLLAHRRMISYERLSDYEVLIRFYMFKYDIYFHKQVNLKIILNDFIGEKIIQRQDYSDNAKFNMHYLRQLMEFQSDKI